MKTCDCNNLKHGSIITKDELGKCVVCGKDWNYNQPFVSKNNMSLKDIIAGEIAQAKKEASWQHEDYLTNIHDNTFLDKILTTAMTKAWEAGREEVLDELREEQKKFTEGFAYRKPKDTPAENLLDDDK